MGPVNLTKLPIVAYREALDAELKRRLLETQALIKQHRENGAFDGPRKPVVLLANGDSWFDYPLNGDVPENTDIIAQLRNNLGLQQPPIIHNLANAGDTTLQSMGLDRQNAIRKVIDRPDINGTIEGILYSGGGNDIAGDPFWLWVANEVSSGGDPTKGLNDRFDVCLDLVMKSYEALVEQRDRLLPGVPIFAHKYDFAIPNGHGIPCLIIEIGPWLQPGLTHQQWPIATKPTDKAAMIVARAITAFGDRLEHFASDPKKNVYVVDTWKTINSGTGWANELHPKPDGFRNLATKFLHKLQSYRPFKHRIY